MDDIDAVIEASRHLKFSESESAGFLNRVSVLPESKRRLKESLKERMRLVAAAYVSLATFVPDKDADYVAGLYGEPSDDRVREIFQGVLREMSELEADMRAFRVTNSTTSDALDP